MQLKDEQTKKPKTLMEFLHSEHLESVQVKAEIGEVFLQVMEAYSPHELREKIHDMMVGAICYRADNTTGETAHISTLIIDAFYKADALVKTQLQQTHA
jgi:hypothetical protein